MTGIGRSARQAGVISLMASLKACLGTGPGSFLRLRLAVIPAVLATLALPAAALGNGTLSAATAPGTPALVGAAKSAIPELKAPQAAPQKPKAPQAAAQAPAEKPASPPEPPAPPRQDVTSAPVVKAPGPVNAPEPAQSKALTPSAGGGLPVDSVAMIVKDSVPKVDAVTADPVGTTTKVVQDVQKDVSNTGLIGGGGGTGGGGTLPPLDLAGTTTKVVQTVQKDVSNVAGLIGGGGTGGGGNLPPLDLVGTTTTLVQNVQKDVSNLAGLIGGGGLPGAAVPLLSPSSELAPSSDLLSNLAGVVYGGATILGTPVRSLEGAVKQIASVPETAPSLFAASSFEPRKLPPGEHSGGSLSGGGSPSGAGPALGSAPPAWDGAIGDPTPGIAPIPAGDRSPPAGRNSAAVPSSLSSSSLAGIHGGIVSPPLERSGGTFPPLPTIPPMPTLPAMTSGAVSTSLAFGLASVLAVLLAFAAARSGFSRRLALEGGRPVGFARLLERPG
jgi:hypothetical protein